jgi:hypothetical protein
MVAAPAVASIASKLHRSAHTHPRQATRESSPPPPLKNCTGREFTDFLNHKAHQAICLNKIDLNYNIVYIDFRVGEK